jgi:diadenylate cyclase
MHALAFSLPPIHLKDTLDILLVAFIIYHVYNLIKGTIAANIMIGLAIIYLLYFIVKALKMQMLELILDKFKDVGIIAIVIVFQQEIRRFLLLVGKNVSFQRNRAWWQYFFGKKQAEKNNYARNTYRRTDCICEILRRAILPEQLRGDGGQNL